MAHTIAEIAAALGAEAVGDLSLRVGRAAEPAMARAGDLALAMAGLSVMMDPGPEIAPGIHPMTVIDPTAQIGAGAAIGPFVTIGAGAIIGARARIASHVSVAEGALIGEDALICQGARIGARVKIGHRFVCQPGAVIGADGFSFVTPEKSGVEEIRETLSQRGEIREQTWTRIHSLGAVTIGDDVEIGANCTIDRGTIRDTIMYSMRSGEWAEAKAQLLYLLDKPRG